MTNMHHFLGQWWGVNILVESDALLELMKHFQLMDEFHLPSLGGMDKTRLDYVTKHCCIDTSHMGIDGTS